jgi:hypothetical protein
LRIIEGYVFYPSRNHVEENHKTLHKEEGVIIIQAVFDDVFEEALGFRVSSEA